MIAWIGVEPLEDDAAASHRSGRSDRSRSPRGTRSRSRARRGRRAGGRCCGRRSSRTRRTGRARAVSGLSQVLVQHRLVRQVAARCVRRPSMSSETTISRVGMASSVRARKALRTMVGPRDLAEGAEVRQAGRPVAALEHHRPRAAPAASATASSTLPASIRVAARSRSASVQAQPQNAREQEPRLLERPGLRLARDGEKGLPAWAAVSLRRPRGQPIVDLARKTDSPPLKRPRGNPTMVP